MFRNDGKTICIVIADKHCIYRRKIKEVIADRARNMEVTAEVDKGFDIKAVIEKKEPDILLLDMDLIMDFGMPAIKSLLVQHKRLRVLVLNNNPDPAYLKIARLIGANGVCLKERIVYDLVTIIESLFKQSES